MAKTVLLVVSAAEPAASVRGAAAFCGRIGAHLSVLAASFAPPLPLGEFGPAISGAWAGERQADLERLKERTEEITALVPASGVSCDVSGAYAEAGMMEEEISRRAIYTDLTLVNAVPRGSPMLPMAAIEATLFGARNPVLLAPADAFWPPRKVMIAWDSRPEAARAVHEALGFLQGSEEARVVMVDPQAHGDSGAEPGADIAAYLARRGLIVTLDRLPSAGRQVSDVLAQHAADQQADLIVMGAYGHSRLRERVFGGVTKSMLDKPPMPLFLAR